MQKRLTTDEKDKVHHAIVPQRFLVEQSFVQQWQSTEVDSRLIRLDYVFRKNRACGALKHNQSYQNASPSIPFSLVCKVLQLLKRTCCVWGLHSPAARVSGS